jgi:hypothetical protein
LPIVVPVHCSSPAPPPRQLYPFQNNRLFARIARAKARMELCLR